MAGHLAKAGHEVRVFNRSAVKAQAWAAEHAGAAFATASEAAAVEWVELALPFPGRAVLRVGELLPAPRLAVGARVRTPFGRGRVLAARDGGDYEVELVDNRLAGWTAAAPAHAPHGGAKGMKPKPKPKKP
jgi:hypothetical protein